MENNDRKKLINELQYLKYELIVIYFIEDNAKYFISPCGKLLIKLNALSAKIKNKKRVSTRTKKKYLNLHSRHDYVFISSAYCDSEFRKLRNDILETKYGKILDKKYWNISDITKLINILEYKQPETFEIALQLLSKLKSKTAV